jgi:putative addiction module component (TIGR02574 family)
MAPSVKSLGIDRLPLDQRLSLVHEIWDTIASEPHVSLLSEAQRQELTRRAAEDDASPDNVIPWEQVREKTLARLVVPNARHFRA